jgi:anti-sigma-K factor RskA
MIDETKEEAASLYVFDLLEGEELRRFESELEHNSELRAFVEEMRQTAAEISQQAPQFHPPAALQSRIFSAIAQQKRQPSVSAVASWIPWALAACLTIACILLAAERVRLQKQVALLESRDALSQMQIATLSSKLESAPRATAVVLWDGERQRGILRGVHIPPNDPNQDYQLWVIDPERKLPVSGAVFGVERDGTMKISFKPEAPIASAKAFAISLERKGGVPKAEGPMVLVSK